MVYDIDREIKEEVREDIKKDLNREIKRNKGILGNDILKSYNDLKNNFINKSDFIDYIIKRVQEIKAINKHKLKRVKDLKNE